MIRFKNMKKIINPKFLYALPVACIGVLCTQYTTNAMFKNPRLGMPLAKSSSGKPLTLPKVYNDKYNPVSYILSGDERTILQTPSKSSLGASLKGLGDNVTYTTTSANGSNLGNSLRNFGDRFNQ